jgi:bacteriorhodopsin
MFFCSWLLFPLFFIAGPEGTGYLTWSGSTIAHTIADLLSKNIW